MKKIITLAVIGCAFVAVADAQVIKPKTTIKQKAEERANTKTDRTIDKGLDKVEEGIDNLFKKKEKKATDTTPAPGTNNKETGYDQEVTKTDDKGNTDYSNYKNFSFIPGERTIFYDNFEDGSVKRWGAYDPESIGVVTNNNQKWAELKGGQFYPLNLATLPKSFTIEFDAYVTDAPCGTLDVRFIDKSQKENLADPWLDNSSQIIFSPVTQMPKTGLGSYETKIRNEIVSPQNEFKFYSWQPKIGNYYARISLSRNNNKLSAWVNKEQVLDNIDVFATNIDYLLAFHLQNYFIEEARMYISNVRLASGIENHKTEIENKKKFVSQNIYFDVNSDIIKPRSYAVLLQIAESLKELNKSIKIIGHTDSDGNDADNLLLSQKRAASVKRALVNEFGVNETLLSTDGKGESQPLNKNTSPTEKAQNRRVEFIQQ